MSDASPDWCPHCDGMVEHVGDSCPMEYIPPKKVAHVPMHYDARFGDYVEMPSEVEPGTYDSVYVPSCRNCGQLRAAHVVSGVTAHCLFDSTEWDPTQEEELIRYSEENKRAADKRNAARRDKKQEEPNGEAT